jgi:hypothetical protein
MTIADLGISKTELKHGSIYELTTPDGERTAEVSYDLCGNFTIWFNGTFIHISKTFPSLEKRLLTLVEKWHLVQI